MSLLLGEAMRDLNDDLTVVLNSFRDIASMHAWAAESPQTALNELRTRFAIAKNVKQINNNKIRFIFLIFFFFFSF